MYFLDKAKNEIAKKINKTLGKKLVKASDLAVPADANHGDLSLPCFTIGKAFGKTPVEAAGIMVRKIKADGLLSGAKAVGPYANFSLNKEKTFKAVITETGKMKQNYGRNDLGRSKRVMVEFSNANTHKDYHIGHLRNISLGDAVSRILSANGYKSLPVSYINDFGIHAAKTLWWTFHNDNAEAKKALLHPALPLKENAEDNPPVSFIKGKGVQPFFGRREVADKGYFLGKMYAESNRKLDETPRAKEEVGEIMKQIESRKGEMYNLWKMTRKWSIEYMNKIYQELGVKFYHIFYESEYIDEGKNLVAELYGKRILERSQGAVIANLEKYKLGVLVVIRADGTALYPVADLPLAVAKFKKYRIKKSIYVVDARQDLYFKQLFKLIELLGIRKEMVHLSYDLVKLPSGMMSSRTGNVVAYDDLREQVYAKAKTETKTRHEDWPQDKVDSVAHFIAGGAMKFEMVKVGSNQVITFDINQALKFDGFTAAYLQYTVARINSIVRKSRKGGNTRKLKNQEIKRADAELGMQNAESEEVAADIIAQAESIEHALVLKLAQFPDAVVKAGITYDPSVIAKYLFDLARAFNDYYHKVPVLKAEEKARDARLKLIIAARQAIANGLGLLGIEALEEM